MSELFSPRTHFRAFGFVVLRDALSADETSALALEGDTAIRDAVGDRYRIDGGDGISGHYIPATGERCPVSVGLVRRFALVVEDFVGAPLIPAAVQHNLLFDGAGWHTDTGHAVPSVNIVAYTEPVDADSGALRVLPGSQRLDQRVLADLLHGPVFRDEAKWREATGAVPAYVIATRPGDVIVFDEHLWHASVGGSFRHQWRAAFVLDPVTPEEELAVRNYLASQFPPGYKIDYDPTHHPHYGELLLAAGPPRWLAQLERLGAIEAAAAEQRPVKTAGSPGGGSTR